MNVTIEQDNIEQQFEGDIAHLTDLPTAQDLPFKVSIRPENNAIQLGHFMDIADKSVALKNHELDRIYPYESLLFFCCSVKYVRKWIS